MRIAGVVSAAMMMAAGSAAIASTQEAWNEFRAATRAACLALLPEGTDAQIAVNPFGTERAGIALVQSGAGAMSELSVCIMDKQTGTAELSAPFAAGVPVERLLEPALP